MTDTSPAAPKRAYGRGDAARKHRNVRLDQDHDAAVAALAGRKFAGNFSAALGYVLERGLATMDAVVQLAAATAEVDRLTAPAPCRECGQPVEHHHGGECPPPL